MGQQDVLNVLEKAKRPMSRGEIAKELGDLPIHTSYSIARLIESKSIKVIEIDRFEAKKRFNCCRRMRLYYL